MKKILLGLGLVFSVIAFGSGESHFPSGIITTTVVSSSNQTVGGNDTISGNATIGGTLGVTGATTLSSTLQVAGHTGLGGATSDSPLTISGGGTSGNVKTIADFYSNSNASGSGGMIFQAYRDDSVVNNRYSSIQSADTGGTGRPLILQPSAGWLGVGSGLTAPFEQMSVGALGADETATSVMGLYGNEIAGTNGPTECLFKSYRSDTTPGSRYFSIQSSDAGGTGRTLALQPSGVGGVAIFKTSAATALDVGGTVTATAFAGDGSAVTGISAGNIGSGTLPAARLPNPSASTLGGIESFAQVSHQAIVAISTSGVPTGAQFSCNDISNATASCGTDATNASNIGSGTLADARLPTSMATKTFTGTTTFPGSSSVDSSGNAALTSITTSGTATIDTGNADVIPITISGTPTHGKQIKFGTSSIFSTVGTRFSGGDVYMAFNARQTTDNTDSWTQSAADDSNLFKIGENNGINFYHAASGTSAGNLATFWGTSLFSVDNSGNVIHAGTTILKTVGTGTNADFLCLKADGTVLLQSTACTISSARFKKDIVDLDEKSGIDELMQLRPVQFKMKPTVPANPDKANFGRLQTGLIAEDVAKVDPRLAVYEDDGVTPKSYRQEAVISILVKAVQEQQAEIEVLRKEVKHLSR